MKVLALYLPQYHEIEENDKWWGDGYTEWTAVRSAVTYDSRQRQPRVPLNNNYYDLSDGDAKTWAWQAKIAKEYNVEGFVIYHYWFKTGKQLLEKPMEILLRHKEIDINYCICWANESWTRTWYGVESEMLMLQEYGDETEWENHFNYLLPFFQDTRYIKINNKPMVNIYHSAEIPDIEKMLRVWNESAVKNGFDGIYVVSGNTGAETDKRNVYDAHYNFEPSYTLMHKQTKAERFEYLVKVFFRSSFNKISRKKIIERPVNGKSFTKRMFRSDRNDNDKVIFPCVFPMWDNSPRRKYKGTFFYGMDTDNFRRQILSAKEKYPTSEFLYVNSWNEWGEGAYLEPDTDNKFGFLEVIRDETLEKNGK